MVRVFRHIQKPIKVGRGENQIETNAGVYKKPVILVMRSCPSIDEDSQFIESDKKKQDVKENQCARGEFFF